MKKLTAGIFTALLGLVTVNAANAAIPSTNYVDEKIDVVHTRINGVESAYKAADTTTLNSAKAYTNQQVGTLTDLTTTAQGNTVAAINEVNSAYKTADTNLVNTKIGTDAMGEIKTGENASVNPTTLTQAVNALNAKIDYKTSGIATDAALSDLTTQVNTNKTDISGLKERMATAEDEIDDLQAADTTLDTAIKANAAAIEANETATTNALASKANTADLGTLAAKNSVATSDLDSTLQTAVTQVATNKSNIESLNTTVGTKAAQSDVTALTTRVTTAEGAINTLASEKADATYVTEQLDQKATVASVDAVSEKADANATAISNLGASKLNVSEHEADQVLITDGSGNVTTSATITQAQVEDLTDDLAAKMTDVTAVSAAGSEDGVYVLTAKIVGDETTYKWELIQRVDNAPN